jgi:ABC-2 type transport system permease protein
MNAIADTWYIVLRILRAQIRMPAFIIMNLVQPILWLVLFTQIFKSLGNMPGIGSSYLQFFAPGVAIMTVLFGAIFSGMGMLMDIDSGRLAKMLATPVTRVSIITGRVVASVVVLIIQVVIVLIISAVMGVHFATGIPGVLFALLLVALLGMGFAAFANGLALLLRRQELVMTISNLIAMPLMFLSAMMMPSALLPGWLNTARHFNPVDYAIVGVRDLVMQGYVWSDLWRSLAVLLALAVVGVAFGTLMFRARAE